MGCRLEEYAFITLTVVPSSEHSPGRCWQPRCPSLGLGHAGLHPAETWAHRRPPSSLAVPSSANIRDRPPLGVGIEVRAVGKFMKNIFGLIASGLESDVVNSEPVLATGLSCTIVKLLKYPVPGSPWQNGTEEVVLRTQLQVHADWLRILSFLVAGYAAWTRDPSA